MSGRPLAGSAGAAPEDPHAQRAPARTARPDVRRAIMPLDRVHPLSSVLDAAVEHARHTGLAPMWAVTLLHGVNDTAEDALALAAAARDFRDRSGKWPMVSVIPYNRIAEDASDPFRRTPDDVEDRFRAVLAEHSVFTRRRYSGGHDVGAACGQLAARNASTPQGRGLLQTLP